jgi:predicted MarR family transcription regulator
MRLGRPMARKILPCDDPPMLLPVKQIKLTDVEKLTLRAVRSAHEREMGLVNAHLISMLVGTNPHGARTILSKLRQHQLVARVRAGDEEIYEMTGRGAEFLGG